MYDTDRIFFCDSFDFRLYVNHLRKYIFVVFEYTFNNTLKKITNLCYLSLLPISTLHRRIDYQFCHFEVLLETLR